MNHIMLLCKESIMGAHNHAGLALPQQLITEFESFAKSIPGINQEGVALVSSGLRTCIELRRAKIDHADQVYNESVQRMEERIQGARKTIAQRQSVIDGLDLADLAVANVSGSMQAMQQAIATDEKQVKFLLTSRKAIGCISGL